MTGNSIDLYAAEALEVHRLLDASGVPRTADNEPLSMSQRVEVLTNSLSDTRVTLDAALAGVRRLNGR